MTFAQLQTELKAMGFEDLSAGDDLTRLKRIINEAQHEINSLAPWPYLYADSSTTAPVSITDLNYVLSVTDATNDRVLEHIDRRTLNDIYPDLPDTGNPDYYYLDSETSLKVYPANTSVTIKTRYIKNAADLSADADVSAIPLRFHFLIVLGAAVRAMLYKDQAGAESAAFLRSEWDRGVETMKQDLLSRQGSATEGILAVYN